MSCIKYLRFFVLTAFLSIGSISCQSMDSSEFSAPLSILQGLTTPTRSHFSIVVPQKKTYYYEVKPIQGTTPSTARVLETRRYQRAFSQYAVDKITVTQLNPDTTYNLIVKNMGGELIDQRQFRALNTSKARPRIVIASCMDERQKENAKVMWSQVVQHEPDLLFLIGDNVYVNKFTLTPGPATPEMLWNRYVEVRNSLPLFRSKTLFPILATWDDYDFGEGDGGADYPHKNETKNIFETFFAQPNVSGVFDLGPGISSIFSAFDLNFLFFDNRTFRLKNSETVDHGHYGKLQRKWALKKLKARRQPTLLIEGGQFFGGHHRFESFEGNQPKSFKTFKKRIQNIFHNRLSYLTG
jgi:hypothetical protein